MKKNLIKGAILAMKYAIKSNIQRVAGSDSYTIFLATDIILKKDYALCQLKHNWKYHLKDFLDIYNSFGSLMLYPTQI